jgi:hypothetical protein
MVAGSKTTLANPQTVKDIAISSYGVGSLAYICAVGIGEAIKKVAGIRTIVVPAGNDVGRILPLRAGEVAFASVTGATGWFVSHGTADFAAPEWGPQPLRIARRGSTLFVGFFTRGDSGIKELSDMKGKRVSLVPGSPTINNLHEGALAFASLILGMGMTITACYLFLAIVLAPVLIKIGLHPLAIHLFVMYWGMISFITPPMALGAFSGAAIARSTPMKTGVQAMRLGIAIYFLPFFFVLNPALVLNGPLWKSFKPS